MKNKNLYIIFILLIVFVSANFAQQKQQTQSLSFPLPKLDVQVGSSDKPQDVSLTLQILLLMTILALAPSIMIMTTAYLRIIIVFHFLKSALGTQQMPPGQLLAGVALFVTFFVMAPTWNKVNEEALKPLMDEKITTEEAYNKGIEPIREFMFRNVRDEDLGLFISLANMTRPKNRKKTAAWL
jgi:flagellar biosynthetic protein FliP